MEKAIKLARENGYFTYYPQVEWVLKVTQNNICLDPLFWQALGKALDWRPKQYFHKQWNNGKPCPEWGVHASRFFELKLTGGDEEKFWEELIK